MHMSFGQLLPECLEDFQKLKADKDGLRFTDCIQCKCEFCTDNTKTRMGWRETQISGLCEKCFDESFADDEDDDDDFDDVPF